MEHRNARARLLDTTRELLWERGYAATSPRAILAGAGVGQGSMYHHFSGKQDLAAQALADTARHLVEAARTVLDADGTAVDRLIGYLTRQRDVLRGCPVGRMTGDAEVVAMPVLHAIVRDTFDEVRTMMTRVVAAGVAAGELPADTDPAALTDTVLAVVQGGYVLARAAADPAPFDRAVEGAVALLLAARCQPQSHRRPPGCEPTPTDEGASR